MSVVLASDQSLKTNKRNRNKIPRHMTTENLSNEEIPFGRPWIEQEEKDAVLDVLNGHILTHGGSCKAFEEAFKNFVGGGFAVSTSSCMASLHLSSLNLKIGK